MILAMDTSAACGLLTLQLSDGRILTRSSDKQREHADWLGRALVELNTEAGGSWRDLERVAVTVGPGSFTGLRVGLATAKGLVFGSEIPLAPLSSLAVPARAAAEFGARPLLVSRPARGEEVWAGRFETGETVAVWERMLGPDELAEETALLAASKPAGKLIGTLPASLAASHASGAVPVEPPVAEQLAALARLAEESDELVTGTARDDLLPRYLLDPAVTRPPGAAGGKDRS